MTISTFVFVKNWYLYTRSFNPSDINLLTQSFDEKVEFFRHEAAGLLFFENLLLAIYKCEPKTIRINEKFYEMLSLHKLMSHLSFKWSRPKFSVTQIISHHNFHTLSIFIYIRAEWSIDIYFHLKLDKFFISA